MKVPSVGKPGYLEKQRSWAEGMARVIAKSVCQAHFISFFTQPTHQTSTVPVMYSMVPAATEEKRKMNEASSSSVNENKRQKVEAEQPSTENDGQKVGATELASAFALASLASLSPRSQTKETAPETRDADNGEEGSTTSLVQSPRTEPVPVSPEASSPDRNANNKRVTFAPGIKDTTRLGSRTQSFPPRVNHGQGSRMPPGFARVSFPPRGPVPPMARMPGMNPYWIQQYRGGAPGQPNFVPPQSPARDQWVCDFCNVAAFPTFQEACAHEEACRARMSAGGGGGAVAARGYPGMNDQMTRPPIMTPPYALPPPPHHHPHPSMGPAPSPQSLRAGYPHMPMQGGPMTISMDYVETSPRGWFEGCVSLAVPESDPDWLSPLNCFMRQNCVEAFSATSEDTNRTSKRGRVSLHQVGIRCVFCKHHHAEDQQAAAISFPVSLGGIYESVKRWQRVHVELCHDVPEAIKSKLNSLDTENAWIPTTRQYWVDSAKSLGMIDTPDGIRFIIDPKSNPRRLPIPSQVHPSSSQEDMTASMQFQTAGNSSSVNEGEHIVSPEDTTMVPPYVYFLIRQVEGCRFTEADRFVARSKGPVGYPGFQCRHCHGHAGLGKYFPVSAKSLATNSTSQNIHAHLLKCRKCPGHIKKQLLLLKEEKSKSPRLEPGWRKIFFDKIWVRLHGSAPPTNG